MFLNISQIVRRATFAYTPKVIVVKYLNVLALPTVYAKATPDFRRETGASQA